MLAIIRMVAVLSLLCAIAGFALSYIRMETAAIIEEQVFTYVQGPAIAQVFPDADNSPIADRHVFTLGSRKVTVFPAMQGGELLGVALENFSPGYGGDVGVMVGFDTSRESLVGIGITTMKETPGIGTKIADINFAGQFTDAELPVALSAQGGGIDAISGATISSAATVQAVEKAAKDYEALKEEILKLWQAGA